jgi:hypothetical protein
MPSVGQLTHSKVIMAELMTNATDLRAPGARAGGDGRLSAAREQLRHIKDKSTGIAKKNSDSLAKGLGWFSVGLGLAQIAAPHKVAELAGIEPTPDNVRLMRSMGMRELTSGVGILTQPVPDKWLWGRVLGDVMDLALLGAAMGNGKNNGRTLGATLAVLGVTGLDILAAREMSHKRDVAEVDDVAIGEKTIFRIITIKAHPANVEKDWNEWVWSQGADESREATVTFAAAPGGRGTEVRAELSYTPKAGKLGEVAQRMTHKSPGQMLGQDLKRFKMLIETGEITKSDASIHKHMHPAQPDDSLGNGERERAEAAGRTEGPGRGNANLIQEDAQ